MTHYANCAAIMNITLIPTQMASGVLAGHLGFQTFFLVVMAASIPPILSAYFAPFPNKVNSQ